MTERSTDQQPMSYSELRQHATRLETENVRLKAYKRNARKALKQLNAKVGRYQDAFRATDQPMSREELQADRVLMRSRAQVAENRVGVLEGRIAQLHGELGAQVPVASADLGEQPQWAEGTNGKAAE